ncbi:conserved Plasmodium protein, unknown function [Plasmodium gallinaceum]|uniref:Uncharacterized protein n=1 Tax=Plasmodium gallinaceum TaxID=5849 RepID=A0A1J1GRW2_PLAGA|nr:conserved Plasmodium protein, unknown function [Plasmodium gallinaceum]CRG95170.1 conserved Plasmodium protein, unknown function [Plasmodium gallinaceum]
MFESLVEKLLNKFLAPYVEGIEHNLHLGVWSGNIVLENLKLKPQITEILDLSFKVIYGNIGRINIQIPWSSLGKNPVCVLIKNVHIYVKPRCYKKSEDVIIEELRKAKMHRLEMLEEEISIIKLQKNNEKSSEKSTLIFKLLNKIINNIQIDIQDILIHFEDTEKNFSIGFILKSSSVKNCHSKEENSTQTNSTIENKKLNHIIEFKGLCIYSNSNIKKKKKKEKEEKEKKKKKGSCKDSNEEKEQKIDEVNKHMKENIENKTLMNNDKTNDISDKMENYNFSSNLKNNYLNTNDINEDNNIFSKLKSNEHNKDDYLHDMLNCLNSFLKYDDKILNNYNFEYLIKPFDLVLPVEQSSNKKELKAKLEISEKWEGITLTKTQITKIIEIMNEANKSRNQTNKLLLKYACTVKLDIESLRNETKNEFMNLYNKVLGEKYNISKIELSSQELNRLQILYDVVGVRHLAKWRLQCKNTLEKIIEEKNLKKKYLYDSIYKQQSWWSWVTGNKKEIENKVQSILKSEQDVLNEKELNILQEAVTNEDNYDVVIPTKYDFEFKVANFSINVYDDYKKKKYAKKKKNDQKINEVERKTNRIFMNNVFDLSNKKNKTDNNNDNNIIKNNFNINDILSYSSDNILLSSTSNYTFSSSTYTHKKEIQEEINILSINFCQIYSSLSLQSVVDHNDHDNFQWKFIIELQNFVAKHKNKVFMEFRKNNSLFPFNMNNTNNVYRNSIFYSLIYSQSLCAYLEINHLIAENGNTLSTLLRLNPLELYLSPLLIKNLLSFAFPLIDIINRKPNSIIKRGKTKSIHSYECNKTEEKRYSISNELNPESMQNKEEEKNEVIYNDEVIEKNLEKEDETEKKAEKVTKKDEEEEEYEYEDEEEEEVHEEALLHIKKMEQSELIEGLKEKGENVYNKAVQHLPELFEFYIHICGPILHFDNLTNGIVELHLGNLVAKTEYPCTYNKFNLIFEFNETQITCLKTKSIYFNKTRNSKKDVDLNRNQKLFNEINIKKLDNTYLDINEKKIMSNNDNNVNIVTKDSYSNNIKEKILNSQKFYILQPIPVKVYVEYDLKILKTNIILDRIFFQINPDAISIILAIPTSITRYLTKFYSKNKKEKEFYKNKKRISVEKRKITSKEETTCFNVQSEMGEKKNNNISDPEKINRESTNIIGTNGNIKQEEESFLYDIDFLIKNSGFSIKNKENCEILKYEACGISYKNYLQKKKKIVKIEIEQLWICDPSNKQPIFFTLAKDIYSKDIFLFRSLSTYLEEKNNNNNNAQENKEDIENMHLEYKNNNSNCAQTNEAVKKEESFTINIKDKEKEHIEKNDYIINSHIEDNKNYEKKKMREQNDKLINIYDKQELNNEFLYKKKFSKCDDDNKCLKKEENCYNYDYSNNNNDIEYKNSSNSLNHKGDKEEEEEEEEEEEDDDFMDAIEEKQLSINLQIIQEQNENNKEETHINFIISDIELHWKYKTIKQIFKTMKEYKKKLQYGIEKDMKYIKNKLNNEKELKNYKMFISEHALRSVQETLKNVKDSLNILDIESAKLNNEINDIGNDMIKNTNKGLSNNHIVKPIFSDTSTVNLNDDRRNHIDTKNINKNDNILNNGLNDTLPKLHGQKHSYSKYFFNCYIKSASLAFWQKKKIFSKIQVSNIFYENKIYLNFDQKMFLNIEKGIISMNNKNIISNNINDYNYDLFVFNKNKKLSVTDIDKHYKEENIENTKYITERKNSKDILNYINVDNLEEEIKKKKRKKNNENKKDLFVGKIKIYNDKRSYNICLLCEISKIYYIFYLNDLKLFLEYLDDGILNVFISKSYKKVVQAAQTKYFLFNCTFIDPIVIIPEDKNIIYNYRGETKNISKNAIDNCDDNKDKENNNIPYIESYLKFHINTLKLKNSYTINCSEQIISKQRKEIEEEKERKNKRKNKIKKKEIINKTENRNNEEIHKYEKNSNSLSSVGTYDFTLYVDLLGIESKACENGGSTNIKGDILHKVNIRLCLINSKDGLYIYLKGNNLYLDLTVFQLAFLLDIINENFCYKGYFPMCFVCDDDVDIEKMINAEWFKKGNINFNNLNLERNANNNINTIDNTNNIDNQVNSIKNEEISNAFSDNKDLTNTKNKPLKKNEMKLFVYINLESLKIKASFDTYTPVAIITFQNISISFHLVLLDFYFIYFFDLFSNSLYIDDVRKNSINYYKRVAYCCIENENKKRNKKGKKVVDTVKKSFIKNDIADVNNNYIFSDIKFKRNICNDNNDIDNSECNNNSNSCNIPFSSDTEINNYKNLLLYMFENNIFLNEKKKNKKQKGIKIKINSFIEDLLLNIELDDAYICCFFIVFLDIYKFLSTGFNLSTLHLYPKPSPYIVSNKHEKKKKINKESDNLKNELEIKGKRKINLKKEENKIENDVFDNNNSLVYINENASLNIKQNDTNEENKYIHETEDENELGNGDEGEKNIIKKKIIRKSSILEHSKFIKEKIRNEKNQVVTNINELLKLDNKPIHISFKVNNGNFIIFTDLEKVSQPIIMWSNNFVFSVSLLNKCIIFKKIYALDSKINRINYVSSIENNMKHTPCKDVSNPLLNYHKKKILLCDNLNVKGEALYESVDTTKENYILKTNVMKKDSSPFISVFELDINIGNFDIRLSNDDVEILLKASSTLFGDIPSSYTNINVGNVIPPISFIHTKIKNKFMRNNIYYISRNTKDVEINSTNELFITNINKFRKKKKIKKKDDNLECVEVEENEENNNRKKEKFYKKCLNNKEKESLENLSESSNVIESFSYALSEYSSSSDSLKSSESSTESYKSKTIKSNKSLKENELLTTQNNEPNNYRDIKISIKLHNVKCTFIDDIRNSIVPIIRMIFSMNLSLIFYTDECSYNINDLNSKVEYFNNCIGEWEPFLEKCNISLDVHKILPNGIYNENIESNKSPISIIKINSVKALWFNITPQLINLLILFIPVFSEKVLKGLKKEKKEVEENDLSNNRIDNFANIGKPNSINEPNAHQNISNTEKHTVETQNKSLYEKSSSVFNSFHYDKDENNPTDFNLGVFINKEENYSNNDYMKDNSVIYYVNLTSDYFYAFVMPETNLEETKKKKNSNLKNEYKNIYERKSSTHKINGKKSTENNLQNSYDTNIDEEEIFDNTIKKVPEVYAKIIATNELISLDKLLINEIANNSLIEKKCLYLYLIPIPPTNIVNIIHDMFTDISKRDIVLDLMITKNSKKTIENFLSINQYKDKMKNRKIIDNSLNDNKSRDEQLNKNIQKENLSNSRVEYINYKKNNCNNKYDGESLGQETFIINESLTTENEQKDIFDKTKEEKLTEKEKTEDEELEDSESGDIEYSEEIERDILEKENESYSDEYYEDYEVEDSDSTEDKKSSDNNYYFKYNKKKKDLENSIFSSSKFIGPFLKNTQCVIINLIKNSCTSLTTSLNNSSVIHIMKPCDFIFEEKPRDNLLNKKNESSKTLNEKSNGFLNNKDVTLKEKNIDEVNKLDIFNEKLIKQTYLARKYRLKNNYLPQTSLVETVCEIISPLPNYKILFMSSTVRIINKCGIPLEFCFFDGTRNPILLTSLENRTIPINTLYPNHNDSFKNYKVSNSLNIIPNIKLKQKNNNLSFTVILNHEYLLSTPECAFCGPSHVYLSFKPINVINEENDYYDIVSRNVNDKENNNNSDSLLKYEKNEEELIEPFNATNENGWSDIFSSDVAQGTYVKKCKYKDNTYLYFLVKIENKISALPAEKNLKIITIYPHVSIVNTIPALVDIIITSEVTEEQQNDYIYEEKNKIDMLKNKKAKLLRKHEEISAFLKNNKSFMKSNNSYKSSNDNSLGNGQYNNERMYVQELSRIERDIFNIDEEIKSKKKELSSPLNKGYVNKRLNPFSIFYIYEIKKYNCLNLKMKIGNSQCEWSEKIYLVENDEESVTRFSLNFKRFASVEVEIIKNFNGYFNSLSSILGNKQLYIFSLPRCFIDRTGLGIKATNSNKYYPIINGITLLGDNSQIDLLLPHKSCNNELKKTSKTSKRNYEENTCSDYNDIFNDYNYPSSYDNNLILFKATLPPIGSYTETNVMCKNFFYTFCLNTEKIKTTCIPYIISRIITIVPQFIISNKLNYPLLIKQYQTDKIQGIKQNDTSPLYFSRKQNILLFEFKTLEPINTKDKSNFLSANKFLTNYNKYYKLNKNIYWSSVIFPSEKFVGTNFMVIKSEENEKSDVYVITCIPDKGTKNIIIEKLENQKKGFLAYNYSSLTKYLKIKTFHDDTQNLKIDEEEKCLEKNMFLSNFLKSTDMEHYFNIEYNKHSYLGWVNPFIYITRNVQIEIVLHDMKVIPKSPFVLKFDTFNYSQKTYYINYYNMSFIISIEYLEDLITIKLTHKINITKNVFDNSFLYMDMKNSSKNIYNNIDNTLIKYAYNEIECIEKYDFKKNYCEGMEIIPSTPSNGVTHIKNSNTQKKIIEHNEYNFIKNTNKNHNMNPYINKYESVKVVSSTYKNVHIIINVTQIGVSIISNILKEEVFFIELSKLCALFYMKNEEEVIDIKITDVQIDCQLESCEKCVLLANRGINTNSNKVNSENDIRKINSYENTQEEKKNFLNPSYDNKITQNNAINKNINANEEKIFLNIYVERSFISHNDVIFKKIQVALDDVEIEMDAETLNGINLLIAEYIESINVVQKKNLLYEEIQKWAVLPIYVNYRPPEIPLAINIQYMQIEKFTLIVWCSFLLDKMHMMSDLLRIGLRILMVSGKLELLGAPVTLNQEIFNNIRVSIKSFYALLKDKYSHSILACLGFIVGYSSLINIPKIPLEIGRNTIGLAVYAVDNISVGIGSFLSNLTFDSEYINRRQKERNFKSNTNMKEGLLNAVKNIGEGVLSLSNIVTKPIEGAQKEGFGGFFKGIGKGVAGSLVKPLDKVGQAVSDVTRGIKAEVSKPIGGHKYKTKRHRKPRMLWGEYGKLKEYNLNEAELRECLGLKFSKNIMKCLTVHKQENHPPSHYALLLYPKVIIYANLYANTKNSEYSNDKKSDIVIWSIKIEDINEIRASSHGIIVKASNNSNIVYKIPCNNAFLINKIYGELHNSKSSINSTIILGDNNYSLYKYL